MKRFLYRYFITCGKYRNFEQTKIPYVLKKALALSVICSKCKNEDEKIFKKKRINYDIKNSWFNLKYIITLKI